MKHKAVRSLSSGLNIFLDIFAIMLYLSVAKLLDKFKIIFLRTIAEILLSMAKQKINKVTALLLDNLWFWAILAMAISLIYGAWALIEATNMHLHPIPPKGW